MSIPSKILDYLKKNGLEVRVVHHKKVYTINDLAATLKEKLDKIAKTLLVKVDGQPYLVMVPGHYYLDLTKIKKALKAKKVDLADEKMIKKILDMEPGALHPFAKLAGLRLLMDKGLVKTKEAIVRAGSFTESLRVDLKDLHKLEDVTLGDFGKQMTPKVKKAAKLVLKKALKKGFVVKKAFKVAVKKVVKKKPVKKVAKKIIAKKKVVKKAVKKVVKKAAKKKRK
jgi:prolyl-tRNA editing enzyme YbaK/EbsC (Cys-tRNA(Pro) deacylase)